MMYTEHSVEVMVIGTGKNDKQFRICWISHSRHSACHLGLYFVFFIFDPHINMWSRLMACSITPPTAYKHLIVAFACESCFACFLMVFNSNSLVFTGIYDESSTFSEKMPPFTSFLDQNKLAS